MEAFAWPNRLETAITGTPWLRRIEAAVCQIG
jgi:hypothetical protein